MSNEKLLSCPLCGCKVDKHTEFTIKHWTSKICQLSNLVFSLEQWQTRTPSVLPLVDGNTSDGYHTFNELYDHRVLLWINYCLTNPEKTYLVENHFEGWFLLGKETCQGQISYHCPNKYFGLVKNIEKRHPEFDGHTSNIVIVRLQDLACIARDTKTVLPLVELISISQITKVVNECFCEQQLGKPIGEGGMQRFIATKIHDNFGTKNADGLVEALERVLKCEDRNGVQSLGSIEQCKQALQQFRGKYV